MPRPLDIALVALGVVVASGAVYLSDLRSEQRARTKTYQPPSSQADAPSLPADETLSPSVDALVAGPNGKAWADFFIELRDPAFLHGERERCEAATGRTLAQGELCEFVVVHEIERDAEDRGRVIAARWIQPAVGSECEALAQCTADGRVGRTGPLDSVLEGPVIVSDRVLVKPVSQAALDPEGREQLIAMFEADLAAAEAAKSGEDPSMYMHMLIQRRGIAWMRSLGEEARP